MQAHFKENESGGNSRVNLGISICLFLNFHSGTLNVIENFKSYQLDFK